MRQIFAGDPVIQVIPWRKGGIFDRQEGWKRQAMGSLKIYAGDPVIQVIPSRKRGKLLDRRGVKGEPWGV